MEQPNSLATFVRAAREDTAIIRLYVPQIQSMVTTHLLLEGVECDPEAKGEIESWCERHSRNERLRLIAGRDFFRDSYGRLLGDLADPVSGEVLTDHLIDVGVASARGNHFLELIREILTPGGPEA